MIFDLQMYDFDAKKIIEKNVGVPEFLNMNEYFWPLSTPFTSTKYEIFGIIAINGETSESMNYISLIKKRGKNSLWNLFKNGKIEEINQNEALNGFFPQILFY